MGRGDVFKRGQGLHPGRSVFDLSYANKFSGKMGYLYPVYLEEVVPGDVFDLGAAAVVRMAPMVAPVLHEIELHYHAFFVPYRILENRTASGATDGKTRWEKFITGGKDGNVGENLTRVNLTGGVTEGSLLDFLGLGVPGVSLTVDAGDDSPIIYPLFAYNAIYNEYYRHESLDIEIGYADSNLKTALWEQDYLTSCLPWQQRGTAPALPISGTTSADWAADIGIDWPAVDAVSPQTMQYAGGSKAPGDAGTKAALELGAAKMADLNNNVVDLSSATTFNVADLRLAVQIQRYLEMNARAGYRYTEFLQAHFGTSPRDDRLDRPEYIGGFRQPINISEVLQTSQTGTTPQGNLAGHGIMAGSHRVGRYHVQEYGLIMGIAYIAPRTAYQQGIRRNWLRKTRYDFYSPEFANLSEQAVALEEIYLQAAQASNLSIFGYQGRYNEMRVHNDEVHGAFRSTLDYWHLGRKFSSAPGLSSAFVHIDPTTITRVFANTSADHLWVHWGNRVRAIRPLPAVPTPGRMDHSYGGY